jgi:aminopeptidase YwaD
MHSLYRSLLIEKSGVLLMFLSIFLFASCNSSVQKEENSPLFKQDISILASDSLAGREAGTQYEIMARDYLAQQFAKAKLQPYFDSSYYSAFDFKDGADYSTSFLWINGKKYEFGSDFSPLSKSRNDSISGPLKKVGYGILSSKPQHNDYPDHSSLEGRVFVMELSVPGGADNYEQYAEYADLDKRIDLASKFGAKAVILVNNDPEFTDPRKMISNKRGRTPIPVVYAKGALLEDINALNEADVQLKVDIKKLDKTGYNVGAYIDNGADKWLVFGAHYDHLGLGGETSRSTEKAIHNGADDNASGVSMVMELARYYANKKMNVNMLFLSFSAEEKGLYGSSDFVENHFAQIRNNTLAYINFDMVGRLDSLSKKLTIFGTGTSPLWDSLMPKSADSVLQIAKSPSGIGGSDQMPFYLDSIPVLFFFSGIHDEYHMPADDENRINYQGMEVIFNYMIDLVDTIQYQENLPYQATNDRKRKSRRYRDGPSLGIMPDYSAEGGVLVNMVIEGKPASVAGILEKDIITSINGKEIEDIYDYMDILKTCKKGESYPVEIKRNGKTQQIKIQF